MNQITAIGWDFPEMWITVRIHNYHLKVNISRTVPGWKTNCPVEGQLDQICTIWWLLGLKLFVWFFEYNRHAKFLNGGVQWVSSSILGLVWYTSGNTACVIEMFRRLVHISKSTRCSSATNVTNSRVSRFNRREDKKSWIFYLIFQFGFFRIFRKFSWNWIKFYWLTLNFFKNFRIFSKYS